MPQQQRHLPPIGRADRRPGQHWQVQSVSVTHLLAWRTGPHAHTRCTRLAREPTRGTLSPAVAPGPDCWTHSTQLTGQLTRWRCIVGFSGTDTAEEGGAHPALSGKHLGYLGRKWRISRVRAPCPSRRRRCPRAPVATRNVSRPPSRRPSTTGTGPLDDVMAPPVRATPNPCPRDAKQLSCAP